MAERAKSRLRLVLVHQLTAVPLSTQGRKLYASLELAARKSERAYLKTFADQLRKQSDVAITASTLSGPVAGTLCAYIQETRPDLVVMTSRGRGGLQRLWLGSVADAVIRGSWAPILLVRPQENPPPTPVLENLGQILVPLDGSPLAKDILGPALALAALARAELFLVQVVQPLVPAVDMPLVPPPLTFDQELTNMRRKEAVDYLEDLAADCRQTGVKASSSAVLGRNVADTILDLVESPAVGLIALATHGRGGLKRLVLGSVADKLVRVAARPLLVYRPPGRAGTKS